MAVSPDQVKTAINDYGPMAQIISAVPDLQRIISDALTQQMSADAFKAAVMASPWYQTHGQAVRNLIMTQASDPAEYQNQINSAAMHVQQAANTMGRQLGPGDVGNLAFRYLAEGWDDKVLQDTLGRQGVVSIGGGYTGDAGKIQGHVQQVAQSYGVAYTDQYVNDWANRIQSGQDTLDGFDSQMRARAKMQYPQFATQIDAGQTMVQIADPYMAQMAKTLELPQTQVTLNDPYIQKALSQRDPASGAVTSQPLWAFNQTLKADPRYDKTVQAKTDAYATLNQVGKDFGFSSGTTGGTTSA